MSNSTHDNSELVFCPQCGTRLPEESLFCPGCGLSLQTLWADQDDTEKAEGTPSEPHNVESATSESGPSGDAGDSGATPSADSSSPTESLLGMSEDDARAAMEVLRSAYRHIEGFRDDMQGMERQAVSCARARKRSLILAMVGVVLSAASVAWCFVILDQKIRISGLIVLIVAACAVEIIAIAYGISFNRMHKTVIENDDRTGRYDHAIEEIVKAIEPLSFRLPAQYRNAHFPSAALTELRTGRADSIGAAIAAVDVGRVITPMAYADEESMSSTIDGIRRSVTASYVRAQRDPVSFSYPRSFFLIKPLLSVVGTALCCVISVALCVGISPSAKTYYAGFVKYPVWASRNVLSAMYSACDDKADHLTEKGKRLSSMVYYKDKETLVLMFDLTSDEKAQNSEALAECMYHKLTHESMAGDQVIDKISTVARNGDIQDYGTGGVAESPVYHVYDGDYRVKFQCTVLDGDIYADDPSAVTVWFSKAQGSGGNGSETSDTLNDLVDSAGQDESTDDSSSADSTVIQDDESGSSPSKQNTEDSSPATDDSYAAFADLWRSVVTNRSLPGLNGTYCRSDGACVSIVGNDQAVSSGVVNYTGTDSSLNPLPAGDTQSATTLAYQDYSAVKDVPSKITPISLLIGCLGSAGCPVGSQASMYYVMPGTDLESFFGERYTNVDLSLPPSSSKIPYLIICDPDYQQVNTVSDATVFYMQ